ncbi:DoxX family protein [Rhizobium sp. BK602]|uniref:DoxX family protein n=1 Tax=Rhizobium sp. BK602 TaxID=2586986 RepID=UPI001622C4D0|nr:DoxX family protein [Rhizobium sp. BK602]MBB3610690.1 putative oxidoreductase [Rhizobium sp. BK602]
MPNITKWTPHVLAILRIVTALLFLEHATMKFFQFPAAIPGVPYPLPTIIFIAGAIEVVTGLLIAAGFYTRIAAFVASGEMAAAYWMAHAPQGFWPTLNMGESAIMFCFIFLYLAFAGAGSWALDNVLRPSTKQVPSTQGA